MLSQPVAPFGTQLMRPSNSTRPPSRYKLPGTSSTTSFITGLRSCPGRRTVTHPSGPGTALGCSIMRQGNGSICVEELAGLLAADPGHRVVGVVAHVVAGVVDAGQR